jgi:hypothetical protein
LGLPLVLNSSAQTSFIPGISVGAAESGSEGLKGWAELTFIPHRDTSSTIVCILFIVLWFVLENLMSKLIICFWFKKEKLKLHTLAEKYAYC